MKLPKWVPFSNAEPVSEESRRKFVGNATRAGVALAVGGTALIEEACRGPNVDPANSTTPTAPIPPSAYGIPSTKEESAAALKALNDAGIKVVPSIAMKLLSTNVGDTLSLQVDALPEGASIKGTLGGSYNNLDLHIPNLHNTAVIDVTAKTKATVSAQNLIVDASGTPGSITFGGKGDIFITETVQSGADRKAPATSTNPSMSFNAPDGFVQFASADGKFALSNNAANAAFKITASRFRAGIADQSIGFDVTASDTAAAEGNLFRFGQLPPGSRASYNASAAQPATAAVELNAIGDNTSLTITGAATAPLTVSSVDGGFGAGVTAKFKNVNANLGALGIDNVGIGTGSSITIDNSALPAASQITFNQRFGDRVKLDIQNAPSANATLTFTDHATIGASNAITLTNSAVNNFPGASDGTKFTIDNSKLTRASQTNFSKQFNANVTLNASAAPNLGSTVTFSADSTIGLNSKLTLTNLAPTFNAAIAAGSSVTVNASANDKLITADFKKLVGKPPINSQNPADYDNVPSTSVTLNNVSSNFSNLGDKVTLGVTGKEGNYPYTTIGTGAGNYVGAYSNITVDRGQTKFDVDTIGFSATHDISGFVTECAVKAAPLYKLNYHCTESPSKNVTLGITSIADAPDADKRNVITANVPVVVGANVGQFSTISAPSLDAKRIADNVIVNAKGVVQDGTGATRPNYVRAESNGANNEFHVDGANATIGIRNPANDRDRYFINGTQVTDLNQITRKDYSVPANNSVCLG